MMETKTIFNLNKGWFKDTLPLYNSKNPIALLRIDGDWYDSTMDCLKNLFPKVAYRGLIVIDDYYTWDGCSKALHEYLTSVHSVSRICTTYNDVCYIVKKDKYE